MKLLLIGICLIEGLSGSYIPRPFLDGRIVGGRDCLIEEAPFTCHLVYTNTGSQFCGCVIISDEWVLTAGHCVSEYSTNVAVRTSCSKKSEDCREYKVKEIQRHPQYDGGIIDYDASLVKIEQPMILDDKSQPAVLPRPYFDVDDNKILITSGYGRFSEGGSSADHLQCVDVQKINHEKCKKNYALLNWQVTDQMVCAGVEEGGKDACQGDSGGPLCLIEDERCILIGLVSWGYGCARPEFYGVYTKVSAVVDWISKKTGL